ncbi:hypothetical protein TNCV_4085761 [Trichonephila clavipes]|nr:hypothetical protein TNCV_4085761 [Trichonephila clavipes]
MDNRNEPTDMDLIDSPRRTPTPPPLSACEQILQNQSPAAKDGDFQKFKLACIAELQAMPDHHPDEPFYRRAVSELQEVEETIHLAVVLKGLPRNFKVEEIQADLEELGFTPEKKFTEAVVATHSHASQPIVNAHRNYTPNHINQLIKHKNNLRKRYQQTLNPFFYKTLCNRAQANLKKELKIYSNDTWNARLEALNTTDNSLWEAQRFLKNKRSQIPTLNCATGMAVTDPQKANLLANTIKNNFIENNRMQDNYDQDDEVVTSAVNTFLSSPPSTQIEPVMPDEIINFIKNTSSKKAPVKILSQIKC